ncbi:MAG: 7-dehydrocholesterol reductase [bacterium]|nr:7-dehydrocholesterol reductase [bacterium]
MGPIFNRVLVPLFLVIFCSPIVLLIWYTNSHLDGSFLNLFNEFAQKGFLVTLADVWLPVMWGSTTAWSIIGTFMVVELLLMKYMPGKVFKGPLTPKGNIPVYKANGVACFLATITLFVLGSFVFKLFSPAIIYDHFGEILGALIIFSFAFCLLLYLKGIYSPSSSDCGTSGNPIFDYYWGTELYPRIFGFDVKMFTNCRFGMMSWVLILLSCAAKQYELFGLSDAMIVAVSLQFLYVAKFYWWETGYLSSLDIMHDRAGYYICWGCLVWVPGFYTSPTLYLVQHPNNLGWPLALALFIVGTIAVFSNYFADAQRQRVRLTKGNCAVWGSKPVLIKAKYQTPSGEMAENLLLASGFWGISRHFHYLPEIAAAFCWSLPALFFNVSPYCYVIFLTVLLFHRAFRDEQRCALKYGSYWNDYCKTVRYKIIPGVI